MDGPGRTVTLRRAAVFSCRFLRGPEIADGAPPEASVAAPFLLLREVEDAAYTLAAEVNFTR